MRSLCHDVCCWMAGVPLHDLQFVGQLWVVASASGASWHALLFGPCRSYGQYKTCKCMGWEPHQLEHLKYSAAQIFYFNFNQSKCRFQCSPTKQLWTLVELGLMGWVFIFFPYFFLRRNCISTTFGVPILLPTLRRCKRCHHFGHSEIKL